MHVVATAGHVDHGKSTLVRALTGMEPDRWAEERRRGMTIDLGFAWTTLPSGAEIAFVDVPGHARFVGNMLAGVSPVPAVLFVVAADEGWRPQSAEHLAALDAYGVRHGLLAVTRSDLADPDPAAADARARLAGSSLGAVESVAVSGATGAGVPELRAALDRLVAGLPAPDATGPVRLWIDRAFTVRGAGAVVTGTLGAGTLGVGDELGVLPGGPTVRVRALETLKRRTDRVGAVARVAVNLRGVDVEDLRRGQALVTPEAWPTPAAVDVRLAVRPDRLPAALTLHVGSAAVLARVRPLGGATARVSVDVGLPLRPGDRLLLRDPSRHDLIVGATVLDVAPPALRRRGAAAARAGELARLAARPDAADEVARRGVVRRRDLERFGVLEPAAASPPGVVAADGWLVSTARWSRWREALVAAVDAHAERVPLEPGLSAAAASRTVGLPDVDLLAPLAAAAGLVCDRGRVARPGVGPAFPPAARAALDEIRRRLGTDPFAAPEAGTLAAEGLTGPVLGAAVRAGLLTRVGDGVYLLPSALEEAVSRLAGLPQPFTTSAARAALGTTRRVAVPLLEALDAAGRTVRVDAAHREVRR